MINTVKIKESINEILSEYAEAYREASELAYNAKLKDLKPGEQVPKKGGLFFDSYRESLKKKFDESKAKGIEMLSDVKRQIREIKTAAPSTDAVNYLALLKEKKHISQEDIDNAIETYGENYIVYKTLIDIANDNKFFGYKDCVIDAVDKGLDEAMAAISSMSVYEAENRKLADGSYISFVNMMLNSSIPDCEI